MPVKPQLRQITSCRARAGQHARPSHKHCKPCAKHAHAISILWNFHTNPYHPSKNYELKQQGDGAGETSRTHKLRVAWYGLGNTRARRTNTAKRAPNMPTHHGHVPIPVCTISILWNFHINPYHPSKNYELKQQGEIGRAHV